MAVTVYPARTDHDFTDAKNLFTDYTTSLNLDLSFQSLATELSTLPGSYTPTKGGELLIARTKTGTAIGCVALRALPPRHGSSRQSEKMAEAKRLYVDPASRSKHPKTGLLLALSIIRAARQLGYDEIKLDSLGDMAKARRMYDFLGFVPCEPYYEVSQEARERGLAFWMLDLRDEQIRRRLDDIEKGLGRDMPKV